MPLAMARDIEPFLLFQLAAREPLEDWLCDHNETPPPRMVPVLANAIGCAATSAFTGQTVWSGHPEEALGLAWLLAGSSLGNRSILAARRKAGLTGGEAFLADPAMPHYWQGLRASLDKEYGEFETRHAVTGAKRGFDHFIACIDEFAALEAA